MKNGSVADSFSKNAAFEDDGDDDLVQRVARLYLGHVGLP